jgi:hypothetical protein
MASSPESTESQGSFLPLVLLLLAVASWIGYREYLASQGTGTAVGTITSCGTADSHGNSVLWYEFSVCDSVYSVSYTTTCAFCNCNGRPTCLGQKYRVVYALKDPSIAGLKLEQPVPNQDTTSAQSL